MKVSTSRALHCVIVAILFASEAFAGSSLTVTAGPGLNIAVPDDGYNGTLASMASHTLGVGAPMGWIITDVNVRVGMSHTWVGDLTIKLRRPDGGVITLVSRPGAAEVADNGANTPAGDSSNLGFAGALTYDGSAASGISAENMGGGLSDSQTICPLQACEFIPNHGAAAPGNLASFNNVGPSGLWTLFIGDSAAANTGVLDFWALDFTITAPCTGDINNDGSVDVNDLLLLVGAWGAVGANPADINSDGVVDVNDLLALVGSWGQCK